MQRLKILILEDDINEADKIIKILSENYFTIHTNTIEKAKEALDSFQFDLAILDIDINGKYVGIEFGKYIQTSKKPIPFLFLTNMQSKTVFNQAKLTEPFTYLLKPFNSLELTYAIELVIDKSYNKIIKEENFSVKENYLFVKKGNSICKLNINDIEYVEVEENYCSLYLDEKKYIVKKSLSKIKQLFNSNFEQTHRKFLVNFNFVKEINLNENTIYLKSGAYVTISHRYKKELITKIDIIK